MEYIRIPVVILLSFVAIFYFMSNKDKWVAKEKEVIQGIDKKTEASKEIDVK